MGLARDRLGSLLEHIRQSNLSSGVTSNGKRSREEDEEESDSDDQSRLSPNRSKSADKRRVSSTGQKMGKHTPTKGEPGSVSSFAEGSPSRKRKRPHAQKKIIFELRQKAFEIQNSNLEHGLYALCRIWMRGKSDKDSVVSGHPIDRTTLDYGQESLLATRSISRKSIVRPETQRKDATKVSGNEEAASDILKQYLPRWRQAKKEWCRQRNQDDAEKYGDSLRVLREMYATAQNHVITM